MTTERRVAIVTGAAGGIGLAIGESLSRRSVTVVSFDLAPCPLDAVVSRIVDLDDHAQIAVSVAEVSESIGVPTLLVNNAARAGRAAEHGLIVDGAVDHFSSLMHTNVAAPFLLTHLFAAALVRRKLPGRIVNMGSASAHRGGAGAVSYATSKSALIGFTRAAAIELAPYGIIVNSVSPGYVATETAKAEYPLSDEETEKLNPVQRTAAPAEIAALVEYLLLDSPSFIVGTDYLIDGGATIA